MDVNILAAQSSSLLFFILIALLGTPKMASSQALELTQI